ncbi:MAG: zf-HC2 domain-containing protein [Ignavibacteriae bacterium]|nr:zf-HC2 domain-containing protein [Ignavibacteriota bacterium]MCB9214885.1 zf-HC2 domain-containing protein [Ignavibacteria bacterium]
MDIEQLISQYLDGELSSEAEGEFHQKLSISPEARALFREHLKLQSIARDERVLHQPTASMQSALFARLQEEEGMAPAGTVPLFKEKEAPSSTLSPTIPQIKPRAVPIPSVDRTPMAATDDQRSEERRRRRRLIPILLPLMLLCIVGGVFLVDGNFFSGAENSGEIAYNRLQKNSDEAAVLSDRDYSDPVNPVVTTTPVPEKTFSTPENSGSGTIALSAEANRKNDSPQLSSKKSTTFARKKALTLKPDEETLAALSTEELSKTQIEPTYNLSPSPKRVSTPPVDEGAPYQNPDERESEYFAYDRDGSSDDWNVKNEKSTANLAYKSDPQDSDGTDFTIAYNDNNETSEAIAPPIPLQDGLSITMTPQTRSRSSRASAQENGTDEASSSLLFNMFESDSDEPMIATLDNKDATLDMLRDNGINIDPKTSTFSVDIPGFNIRGGRGNAPLVEQNSGFEILERTADSVRIGYGIGRAAAQNMQTNFTLSTEDFERLGGVDGFGEGLSLARNGAAVSSTDIQLWNTGNVYDNTGNIYRQDSMLNAVATNATSYSVGNQKWQSTTNLPNASSPILGEGSQKVEEKEGIALLSEVPLENSTSTISAEREEGRTFFIGIEGSLIAGLNSSGSSFLNSDFAIPSQSGIVPETRLSFGIDLGRKGKHRFFGTIGLSPYSEREISRTQTTARSVEQITETLISVDASGVRQTVGSVTREQISTSTSTSVRDAERSIVEMWGGVGYRFSIPLVREWKTGLEVVGGIGTKYAHASFAIPISYSLGNTIRIEFKPGMHYRTSHTTSEPVTTGTLDPTAPSSSRIESTQGPADNTRLDAGAGIGLILFLR